MFRSNKKHFYNRHYLPVMKEGFTFNSGSRNFQGKFLAVGKKGSFSPHSQRKKNKIKDYIWLSLIKPAGKFSLLHPCMHSKFLIGNLE